MAIMLIRNQHSITCHFAVNNQFILDSHLVQVRFTATRIKKFVFSKDISIFHVSDGKVRKLSKLKRIQTY